jgi:hypothetical protein
MDKIAIATKGGRAANGFQRDQGSVTHAIPNGADYGFQKALCGTEPGRRSIGWTGIESKRYQKVICEKCKRKMS